MNQYAVCAALAAWMLSGAVLATEPAKKRPPANVTANVTATVNGAIVSSDETAITHSSQPHGAPPRVVKNNAASPQIIVVPRVDLPNQRNGGQR
jgi:hypothetical protein